MKKGFFISIFISILPSFSYAIDYKCPNIKNGDYSSMFNVVDNWYIYAIKLNGKTIYNFEITRQPLWDDFTIETTEDETSSLLFCSAMYPHGFVNSLRSVDSSNCRIDKINKSFHCP
ncbi:hypothetical protein [Silvanigrella sp.]|jgi:hypothetical protein|uniref:hypothetical protein n=1 Tax=Silvanigrella sp. TaxID=2024976 RepID=UPI0037CBF2B4